MFILNVLLFLLLIESTFSLTCLDFDCTKCKSLQTYKETHDERFYLYYYQKCLECEDYCEKSYNEKVTGIVTHTTTSAAVASSTIDSATSGLYSTSHARSKPYFTDTPHINGFSSRENFYYVLFQVSIILLISFSVLGLSFLAICYYFYRRLNGNNGKYAVLNTLGISKNSGGNLGEQQINSVVCFLDEQNIDAERAPESQNIFTQGEDADVADFGGRAEQSGNHVTGLSDSSRQIHRQSSFSLNNNIPDVSESSLHRRSQSSVSDSLLELNTESVPPEQQNVEHFTNTRSYPDSPYA